MEGAASKPVLVGPRHRHGGSRASSASGLPTSQRPRGAMIEGRGPRFLLFDGEAHEHFDERFDPAALDHRAAGCFWFSGQQEARQSVAGSITARCICPVSLREKSTITHKPGLILVGLLFLARFGVTRCANRSTVALIRWLDRAPLAHILIVSSKVALSPSQLPAAWP